MKKVFLNYLVIAAIALAGCKKDEKTYTVTFNSNEGSAVETLTVKEGEKVAKPADPTRAGYAFAAWFKEAALTNEWNFAADVVTDNITLYAKWTQNTHTVTFNSNGGSEVAPQTVAEGAKATKPADPTKEGYTFDGWYKESGLTTEWKFDTDVVTTAITLYAKWNEIVKLLETVTYDVGVYDKFEYDNLNRLAKITGYYNNTEVGFTNTFTYDGDDLVQVLYNNSGDFDFFEFTKNGSQITQKHTDQIGDVYITTIVLDGNGLPEKREGEASGEHGVIFVENYEYQNGNLMRMTVIRKNSEGVTTSEDNTTYQYDNKKAPFSFCKTPKWYMLINWNNYSVRNNKTEKTYSDGSKDVFTYEFDSAGYPTKRTDTFYNSNGEKVGDAWVETFTYITK